MTSPQTLPKLITFDGEARSGKGTIVQATKDFLRDEQGYKVMLIDGGQVFRSLVVAASGAGIDLDDPAQIDKFLSDDESADMCVRFVKDVYRMSKQERDKLLYSNSVSADSARIGARPLSQDFKDEFFRKWLRDAASEGFEIVLLDGRALEETGTMLENEGLCDFIIGLYFICDPLVGARRTLGHAEVAYENLNNEERVKVDELVEQINDRNTADRMRDVQPIVQPVDAPLYTLPNVDVAEPFQGRFMATIDTSADMTKDQMCVPVTSLIARLLTN